MGGKNGLRLGRPVVVDKVGAELVVRLRAQGMSWREIAEEHPAVKSGKRKVRPSVGSIRRAWAKAPGTGLFGARRRAEKRLGPVAGVPRA